MADRTQELAAALYTQLSGHAPLTALIGAGKVFNGVKDGTPLPYVDIGEETATDYGAVSIDAQEHTQTVHVWTEQPLNGGSARLQCLQIVAAVRAALHEQVLSLSSGTLCNLRCEYRETLRDPDGVSWHGVLRFRAVTNS